MENLVVGKLAEALAKAQGEMENAAKDKDNPFFKSTYADLASVWGACRAPLSKNNLAITQTLGTEDGKLILVTRLIHSSGEYLDSKLPINPVKPDPQSVGSAITYARRFSLAAMVGVCSADSPSESDMADDDGHSDSDRPHQKSQPVYQQRAESPVKPVIAAAVKPVALSNDMNAQYRRMKEIQAELRLSTDDLKAQLFRLYGVDTFKNLPLPKLVDFVKMLEKEKASIQEWENNTANMPSVIQSELVKTN